jgi:hypothetical protein
VDWVKDTFDEAEFEGAKVKFKAAIREDWSEAAKRLLLELEKADDTIIFLFDELPAMLDRIIAKQGDESARDFLAWFRPVRVAQKDILRRHRFIVAGSVGIDQAILRSVAGRGRISRPALFDIYRKAQGRGASEQGFDDIMADLEYDWYLRLDPDTNEFYFRLKIMQDWWRRWYPPSAVRARIPSGNTLKGEDSKGQQP